MHVVRELLKNSCQASLELATWVIASVGCVSQGKKCSGHEIGTHFCGDLTIQ